MIVATLVLAAVFGLVVGSFMNNYAWRVHTGDSIVKGRSRCPDCKHPLRTADLVPLVSWLFLKGRCRYCKARISRQYPLAELAVAVAAAVSAYAWSFNSVISAWQFGVWVLIIGLFVALIVSDMRWMLLPNRILKSLLVLVIIYQLLSFANGAALAEWLLSPLVAGAVAFGLFYLLYILGKGNWMGGGDVKLVFVLGLLLGITKTAVALFLAFNVAAVISLAMLAMNRYTRKDLIPFGPYLLLGAFTALLYGDNMIEWYLALTGLDLLL